MKRTFLFCTVFFLCIAGFSFPDQLSKIAVVDFQEVIDNFPNGSPAFSRLQILKDAYEEKRLKYLAELNDKELELLDAKKRENELEIARLEREITDFKTFIKQWQEIKIEEIQIVQKEFLQGGEIALDMLRAIEFVAINEGYTLVMDANDISVIWWSPEIDITDLVINRLKAMAR
jgi:outer membrane protein